MDLKYIITLLILVQLINQAVAIRCDKVGFKKYDQMCARLTTVGNSGRKFPESDGPELKRFCQESDRLIKDMEKFKNQCFNNLSRQSTSILLYSLKNSMRNLCQKDSKRRTALLMAAPCFNHNDKVVTKCYEAMIDGFLGAQNAHDDKKLGHLCCEYARIISCMETNLAGAKKCTSNNIMEATDFVRSLLGNTMDLICGDYLDGSDKCDKLGPPPKKLRSQRRTKSFAIPALDLIASFPQL